MRYVCKMHSVCIPHDRQTRSINAARSPTCIYKCMHVKEIEAFEKEGCTAPRGQVKDLTRRRRCHLCGCGAIYLWIYLHIGVLMGPLSSLTYMQMTWRAIHLQLSLHRSYCNNESEHAAAAAAAAARAASALLSLSSAAPATSISRGTLLGWLISFLGQGLNLVDIMASVHHLLKCLQAFSNCSK